jgi:hypothetical protein
MMWFIFSRFAVILSLTCSALGCRSASHSQQTSVIAGGFAVATARLRPWVAASPKAEKSAPTIRITPALGRAEGGIGVLGSF